MSKTEKKPPAKPTPSPASGLGGIWKTLNTPVEYKDRNLTGGTWLRSRIAGTTNKSTNPKKK